MSVVLEFCRWCGVGLRIGVGLGFELRLGWMRLGIIAGSVLGTFQRLRCALADAAAELKRK